MSWSLKEKVFAGIASLAILGSGYCLLNKNQNNPQISQAKPPYISSPVTSSSTEKSSLELLTDDIYKNYKLIFDTGRPGPLYDREKQLIYVEYVDDNTLRIGPELSKELEGKKWGVASVIDTDKNGKYDTIINPTLDEKGYLHFPDKFSFSKFSNGYTTAFVKDDEKKEIISKASFRNNDLGKYLAKKKTDIKAKIEPQPPKEDYQPKPQKPVQEIKVDEKKTPPPTDYTHKKQEEIQPNVCDNVNVTLDYIAKDPYTLKLSDVKEIVGSPSVKFTAPDGRKISLKYTNSSEPLSFEKEIQCFNSTSNQSTEDPLHKYWCGGSTYIGDKVKYDPENWVASWHYEKDSAFPRSENTHDINGKVIDAQDLHLPNSPFPSFMLNKQIPLTWDGKFLNYPDSATSIDVFVDDNYCSSLTSKKGAGGKAVGFTAATIVDGGILYLLSEALGLSNGGGEGGGAPTGGNGGTVIGDPLTSIY